MTEAPKIPAHGAKNHLRSRLPPLEDRRSDWLLHDLVRLPGPPLAKVATHPNKQLRPGSHRSVRSLEAAIWEFLDTSNADGKPFVWSKRADEILASIARFAQRTLAAHS